MKICRSASTCSWMSGSSAHVSLMEVDVADSRTGAGAGSGAVVTILCEGGEAPKPLKARSLNA
jgi:hypothetical protein